MPRRTAEHSSLAVFMIGKIIFPLLVQILHINRVASRTDFNSRSPRDFRQARTRSDLGVRIVAKLGGGVVHLASDFLVLIGSRSRDLLRFTVTF